MIEVKCSDSDLSERMIDQFHSGGTFSILGFEYVPIKLIHDYSRTDDAHSVEFDAVRVSRPEEASWNGTGLPPVGTVCECQDNEFVWHKGVIVYVGNDCGEKVAVMQCKNELLWGAAGEFRPVRTPEQIAAEERTQAIYAMARDCPSMTTCMAGELYDAGYRKQPAHQPKEP